MLRLKLITCLVIATACTVTIAADGALPAAPDTRSDDNAFLLLRDAVRQDDASKVEFYAARMVSGEFASYVDYYRLKARLRDASDTEIRQFLSRYAGSAIADRLRNDWLLELGRRGDWANFDEQYPLFVLNDDFQVKCYALQSRVLKGQRVAGEARALLVAPSGYGEACGGLIAALAHGGQFDANDLWAQVRLAGEFNATGQARRAAALLNASEARVAQAIDLPALALAKGVGIGRAEHEIYLVALGRMARTSVKLAALALDKALPKLSPQEQAIGWANVALAASYTLAPETGGYWSKSNGAPLSLDAHQWKTRIALRDGNWKQVRADINAMPPVLRNDPTWIYWLGRALAAELPGAPGAAMPGTGSPGAGTPGTGSPGAGTPGTGSPGVGMPGTGSPGAGAPGVGAPGAAAPVAGAPGAASLLNPEAAQQFGRIADQTNFYGQLAAEELGRMVTIPAPGPAILPAEIVPMAARPGFQRALRFFALRLRFEATREWNWELRKLSERELLAAAEFARQNNILDRMVNTSERTRIEVNYSQRFPAPHNDIMHPTTQTLGLDKAWVYGLIRQESRFIMDAQSHVGASGLMQVMPSTGRYVAKKIGLTDFVQDMLSDARTNILLGANYMNMVLGGFDGSQVLATAAYNAGPGRLRSWRSTLPGPLEGAVFAESIPFAETRQYVKNVMSNSTYYAAIFENKPQSLKARLGTVVPKGTLAQAAQQ